MSCSVSKIGLIIIKYIFIIKQMDIYVLDEILDHFDRYDLLKLIDKCDDDIWRRACNNKIGMIEYWDVYVNDKYKKYIKKLVCDNEEIADYVQLTHLIIGYLSKPINLSAQVQLTHLTFCYNFNQQIDLSSQVCLTHLSFGGYFNQHLDLSAQKQLIQLSFGKYFNQPIDLSAQTHLTNLTLPKKYLYSLNLPANSKTKIEYKNIYIFRNL